MSDARRTIAALKQVGAFVPHKLHRNSDASADGNDVHDPAAQTDGVDLEQWPNAQRLLDRCRDFFAEVEDLYAFPTLVNVLALAKHMQNSRQRA